MSLATAVTTKIGRRITRPASVLPRFVALVAPALIGLPEVGETLSTSAGTYSTPPQTTGYAWYVDDVLVSQAAAYQVQPADLGKTIQLVIRNTLATQQTTHVYTEIVRTAHIGGITIGSYTIGD